MTRIALVRHAPTPWSLAGRLQGRADPPLAPCAAAGWRMPQEIAAWRVLSSPLARAVATARLLGSAAPEIEPRLIEMSWGDWEGRRLVDLRAEDGPGLIAAEAEGLDFRPQGGESPREVQARVAPLLREIARDRTPAVAVTHKGVIRAVLALATQWDMRGKPPCRLDWAAAHLFRLDTAGRPEIERLNVALAQQ